MDENPFDLPETRHSEPAEVGSWRFSLRSMFVIITLVGIGLALPGELTLVVATIGGIWVLARWLWGDPREWMLLGVAVYVLLGLLRLCIDVAR